MRYTLTKDFTKIKTVKGILQNVSGGADIEITDDIAQQGLLLKPLQTVNINTTVYARRLSGGGTCALAVLPFADSANVTDGETPDGDTTETENTATDTTGQTTENYPHYHHHEHKPPMPPYFSGNIFGGKPEHKPHFPPPSPNFPPPNPKEDGLIIKIPPEALANGQTKFVVELPDRKKG